MSRGESTVRRREHIDQCWIQETKIVLASNAENCIWANCCIATPVRQGRNRSEKSTGDFQLCNHSGRLQIEMMAWRRKYCYLVLWWCIYIYVVQASTKQCLTVVCSHTKCNSNSDSSYSSAVKVPTAIWHTSKSIYSWKERGQEEA